jgi:hypothetical protein
VEHLVDVAYLRHRLVLEDLQAEYTYKPVRGLVLDVYVDHRYRCQLRGVVTQVDLRRWAESHIAEPHFVALVARYAAERLKTAVLTGPEALKPGTRHTIECGECLDREFASIVMASPGAVVLSFTTQ